jgi:hypothetical protein
MQPRHTGLHIYISHKSQVTIPQVLIIAQPQLIGQGKGQPGNGHAKVGALAIVFGNRDLLVLSPLSQLGSFEALVLMRKKVGVG